MSRLSAQMPLHDSPWVPRHDSADVENYIAYYRALASGIADLLGTPDSRTADSFLTGAQQALVRFNISTRAHKKTSRSTFRFAEQKDGKPVTVFLVADASRINAQMPTLALLQWCMFQELKRHPNKEKPVYLLADEATNFRIEGLAPLLTWGRGYGLRLHLFVQSLSAFRATYGRETLNVLLSECEIKQFLPGQREPETLELIERILGQQSIIAHSHSGSQKRLFGIEGNSTREDGKPLMTADEIRRTRKTILIIRRNLPLLTDLPPIAAIAPFRKMIDINPFHGRPFLKPVRLRIRRRDGSRIGAAVRWLWACLAGRARR